MGTLCYINDAFLHHKANPSLSLSPSEFISAFLNCNLKLESPVKQCEPRQESVVVTQVEFAWMQLDA